MLKYTIIFWSVFTIPKTLEINVQNISANFLGNYRNTGKIKKSLRNKIFIKKSQVNSYKEQKYSTLIVHDKGALFKFILL